jgi:hypothetical protein
MSDLKMEVSGPSCPRLLLWAAHFGLWTAHVDLNPLMRFLLDVKRLFR